MRSSHWIHIYYLLLCGQVLALDVVPRWGQATTIINDELFVFGGKTDVFNSFSYTSAPNTNDLLYLPLSTSFLADSPPWIIVSGSENSSTSQGPALSWSTLSAYTTSDILLFGGEPGPNSDIVIVDAADSAVLLDVFSRLQPNWIVEPPSWVGEPIRRIRHATVTSPSGLVFIFGGEKADGSKNGFSDHFMFDPNAPSFTLLPSNNAPPDIYGHAAIILSDGRILVFGGFSQSQGGLIPFSTIWILDTKSLSWSVITTDTSSLPDPRMAFVAVLIPGGKILIHGGSDANLQSNFANGWVLDTTMNPMTWTPVAALSQLGARRDHFAVSSADMVIFGFGYQNSGPAPASLQIFNPANSTFVPMFIPPLGISITQTIPRPTQQSTSHGSTTHSSTRTASSSSSPNPTGGNGNGNGGGNGNSADDNSDTGRTTAIAVGTALGVVALLFIMLTVGWVVRRQRREIEGQRRFSALGDDDDGRDSPHFGSQIPIAGTNDVDDHHHSRGLLGTLGIAGALSAATKMRSVRKMQAQRRDMLADEDTRSFGEWYKARQRSSTGNSTWSLLSIFGGAGGSNRTPRIRSREPSTRSHASGGPSAWREKGDPFSDGAALMKDEETGFVGAAASRPRARRDLSYASYVSSKSGTSYRDPFADPVDQEARELFSPTELYNQQPASHDLDPSQPTIRQVPPSLAPLTTVVPLSQQVEQTLSPLTEHTSRSTLGLPFSTSGSSQAHSSENIPSPFTGGGSLSRATSMTSFEPTSPGSPKATSIIGAADSSILNTNQPMRRSDSWWSRFSRSSILDRRSSDANRASRYPDIRDPNPPPRLGAIEEGSIRSGPATGSSPGSADQPKSPSPLDHQKSSMSRANSGRGKLYAVGGHEKSMTSIRTADSEAIERMAGTMDVVQRVKSRNRWSMSSRGSGGTFSSEAGDSLREGLPEERGQEPGDLMTFESPIQERSTSFAGPSTEPLSSPPSAFKETIIPIGPLHLEGVKTPTSPTGKVSERIRAFEKRLSQDQSVPLPTNTRQREERTGKRVQVDYGLVPRPSLYVANPDNRRSFHSTDSSS